MKKILFGLTLAAYASCFGQSMSENFDARTVGDYMGVVSPDWTTWSGTVGGEEDVQVTDAAAASGDHSIYFSTTAASGGPQDVLIPFGGEYNYGTFTFESKFYIEEDKGAYFNFQGTETPGGMYTMNCQMVNDGRLLMDAGAAPLIETMYPSETWFTLTVQVNLNTNTWELFIDGMSQGSFSNPNNQVASADLYPVNSAAGGNDIAGYFMDDVMYEYIEYTLPERNMAVTEITNVKGLSTANVTPSVRVRNLGTSTITSFDLSLTYDGTTHEQSITDVSISSLEIYEVDFADFFTLIPGDNDIVATVSNVNGTEADDDPSDDTKARGINPVVPAPGKIVVGEEGTGTWCGWCPRGAVYLERMAEDYPDHFVGIAVHNGDSDPMTVTEYDSGLGTIISGYPSMVVDRGADIDPSAVEGDFLDRIVVAPKAVLTIGSDYTDGATSMSVSVTADFEEAVSGDYRLALVVIEDHVTGTESGYAQANYYSGGDTEMGGYEDLPNPVPATDMVYDHVGRLILPGYAGMEGSFPEDVESGASHTVGFNVTIDPEWDLDEVHLVGLLIDPDGDVDNAGIATMDEAAERGYLNTEEGLVVESNISLYPNPTRANANIDLGEVNSERVTVEIYDMNGKRVTQRDYGVLDGTYILPLESGRFDSGVYSVRITKGSTISLKKLIIE